MLGVCVAASVSARTALRPALEGADSSDSSPVDPTLAQLLRPAPVPPPQQLLLPLPLPQRQQLLKLHLFKLLYTTNIDCIIINKMLTIE